MNERAQAATALLERAMDWLREHYGQYEFWVERDLVWTVQTRLRQMISEGHLPYQVFNDYPLLPGTRRARCADIVICGADGKPLVAAEFKYEPSHHRAEFLVVPGRLPVVFWGAEGVAKDIARIREFVEAGAVQVAFAVFIDEGQHFRHRPAHPGSTWRSWQPAPPSGYSPAVLWARWPAS